MVHLLQAQPRAALTQGREMEASQLPCDGTVWEGLPAPKSVSHWPNIEPEVAPPETLSLDEASGSAIMRH